MVVALLAGVVAMVLAWVSVPLYLRFVPPDVPRVGDIEVRWSTLLFTGVVSALAALLCGVLPALRASEPSLDRLRDGSRGSTSRRHWARDGPWWRRRRWHSCSSPARRSCFAASRK